MAPFSLNRIRADVLVLGAGGAGARAAIEAARAGSRVLLACRSPLGRGGLTPTANGGYHAAVLPDDSPATHAEELIALGRGLNDRPLVGALTRESLDEARTLERFGARVSWKVPPKPHEVELRFPRSLFVPGKEMLYALGKEIRRLGSVTVLKDHLALQLLTRDGELAGALLLDLERAEITVCESKATILATGSLGEIYPLTAQEPLGVPTGSTGSGYALAASAGADLVDMEMIQFAVVPVEPPLIQGLRCLPWAPLTDSDGNEFLPPGAGEYSHQAAQAVYRALLKGPVTMDLRGREAHAHARHPLARRRQEHLQACRATPYHQTVSVGLGSLYMMGGVHVNARCETTVPALFAAGEVSGNVHGARRVSGNAFPEIVVFGARAGKAAAELAAARGNQPEAPEAQVREGVDSVAALLADRAPGVDARALRRRIRSIAGEHLHAVRSGHGLKTALQHLTSLEGEISALRVKAGGSLAYHPALLEALDVRWMLPVAKMVCLAALEREESRGFHFREDFPEEVDSWMRHTVVRDDGGLSVGSKPVETRTGHETAALVPR